MSVFSILVSFSLLLRLGLKIHLKKKILKVSLGCSEHKDIRKSHPARKEKPNHPLTLINPLDSLSLSLFMMETYSVSSSLEDSLISYISPSVISLNSGRVPGDRGDLSAVLTS